MTSKTNLMKMNRQKMKLLCRKSRKQQKNQRKPWAQKRKRINRIQCHQQVLKYRSTLMRSIWKTEVTKNRSSIFSCSGVRNSKTLSNYAKTWWKHMSKYNHENKISIPDIRYLNVFLKSFIETIFSFVVLYLSKLQKPLRFLNTQKMSK